MILRNDYQSPQVWLQAIEEDIISLQNIQTPAKPLNNGHPVWLTTEKAVLGVVGTLIGPDSGSTSVLGEFRSLWEIPDGITTPAVSTIKGESLAQLRATGPPTTRGFL